jgi:hypothetical protein
MVGTKMRQNSTQIRFVSSTDADWQNILDTISHDFYHLPAYLALEAKRSNAAAEAILIEDGGKVFFLPYLVRDCLPLLESTDRGIDRIYDIISPYGYPGILVNQAGQNSEFMTKCLDLTYDCWQKRNICSAFIRLHPILNNYIDRYNDNRFVFCSQGDVVICDLTKNLDAIWKQIRSSHRNKINKLSRTGFTVKMGSIDEYLDIFIDIYRETMDRVNANTGYYFTRSYFEELSQALGDRINICIVEIDSQVVAASLVTEFGGIVQYHLGGTRTEFLRQSPATIMFNFIIEWAKARGNRYLNIGGGFGGNKDSLYHFKSGFSDEVASFKTIKAIVNENNYYHLTSARAELLGITISELENTSFFPAYRSG